MLGEKKGENLRLTIGDNNYLTYRRNARLQKTDRYNCKQCNTEPPVLMMSLFYKMLLL